MKLPEALEALENSSDSAALALKDHLETVADNGPEYATPEAIRTQAESVRDWAVWFLAATVE